METLIRPAVRADWPAWHALDRALEQAAFEGKCADGTAYVALCGDRFVGVMRYSLFWDSIPFCNLLCIDAACRRKGIGRALMGRWEEDMKAKGHGLLLTSTQADETAQHFYRKLGYKDLGGFTLDFPGITQPLEIILGKGI
ncbi:MAG: GNAT family N-acetyltransferase [Clostridia bacterium]|nr:GNAT family N-acetyltransferase [Clostridia bacterium]